MLTFRLYSASVCRCRPYDEHEILFTSAEYSYRMLMTAELFCGWIIRIRSFSYLLDAVRMAAEIFNTRQE